MLFRSAGPDPRARFNLGYTLLLEGAIADGLPLLESRKAPLGTGRGLAKKEWDGRPQPGRRVAILPEDPDAPDADDVRSAVHRFGDRRN